MAEYKLIYPSMLESEEQFLDDLVDILLSEGIYENLGQGLTLTLSEAFTNALVHGNSLNPEKKVHVNIAVSPQGILADITDEGRKGLERIGRCKPPDALSDHGRGLPLMQHYAGELTFSETASGGLKVSLYFDRKCERIGK